MHLLLLLTLAADPFATFKDEAGGFEVMFPAPPSTRRQGTTTAHTVQSPSGLFAATWSDHPEARNVLPHERLEAARRDVLSKGKKISERRFELERGQALVTRVDDEANHLRIDQLLYTRGERLIQLLAMTELEGSGAAAETFFASFKLTAGTSGTAPTPTAPPRPPKAPARSTDGGSPRARPAAPREPASAPR